jgi:tetratricopeptide (TPR) repeat protein
MNKTQEKSVAKETIENPDLIQDKFSQTEEFFSKNKNILIGIAGAVLLTIGGLFGYNYYIESQDKLAQEEMYRSVYYFENDEFDKALEGDANKPGLLHISDKYSATKSGNLANFYIGVIYLNQGKFEEAISYLEDFSANDLLVQARAYALIGDAHMELNNFDKALSFYNKAAGYKENEFFTPSYLMKAALASELNNDYASAVKAYDKIIDSYPKAQEISDAKKFRARANELASNN